MISSLEQDSSNQPVVVLEKVSMRYGRGEEIFSDINLALPARSFTFLTGASGAGKSTLLKLIYLALQPTRGLVRLFGQDIQSGSRKTQQQLKRRIGVVSQDFGLIPHMNVYENAVLPLMAAGKSISAIEDDAKELLAWVGLGDRIQARPTTLSGGEAQRLAIARAVMNKPDILIADEPTGNVDPAMGQKLLRLFQEMNRTGTTIIIATHDPALTETVIAEKYKIVNGRLEPGSVL